MDHETPKFRLGTGKLRKSVLLSSKSSFSRLKRDFLVELSNLSRTIEEVLIYKTFYSVAFKSDLRTLDVSHSSQSTSETTGKGLIHTSYQNNVAMDDPV